MAGKRKTIQNQGVLNIRPKCQEVNFKPTWMQWVAHLPDTGGLCSGGLRTAAPWKGQRRLSPCCFAVREKILFDFFLKPSTQHMRNDTHLSVGEVQRDVLKGRDWLLLALSALVHSMLGLLVEGIGWGWFSWHVAGVQRNSLDRTKEDFLQKTSYTDFTTSLNHVQRVYTCVMGDSKGDIVGESCLARPLRWSLPGDRVRGLMGAGRRRGELLDRRREELMEGLLSDDWSWQLLRDAWMDGLLREEDRPVKGGDETSSRCKGSREWIKCIWNRLQLRNMQKLWCSKCSVFQNTGPYCAAKMGGWEGRKRGRRKELIVMSLKNRVRVPVVLGQAELHLTREHNRLHSPLNQAAAEELMESVYEQVSLGTRRWNPLYTRQKQLTILNIKPEAIKLFSPHLSVQENECWKESGCNCTLLPEVSQGELCLPCCTPTSVVTQPATMRSVQVLMLMWLDQTCSKEKWNHW